MQLADKAYREGVKQFIYASSASVYGIKKEKDVTEDMILEPLTEYSKFKVDCEKVLNSYKSEEFITTTIRPSTVCGYAKRQRLDLVVNILTNHAFHNKTIKVNKTSTIDTKSKEIAKRRIFLSFRKETTHIVASAKGKNRNCLFFSKNNPGMPL